MRNNIIAAILRKRANAGGGGYTPPMDAYSNRVGMYSVARQLVTGATAAIRVRRSSDNAEQDIGFTAAGELDQSALLAHVGSNDGFITKIYEQGGGTAITQTTSTAQPRIVISGTVVTSGGKPAADFDGTSDWMDAPESWDCGSATTYIVSQSDTTSGNRILLASSKKWYLSYLTGGNWRCDIGATSIHSSTAADTAIHQFTAWSSSTQAAYYLDGSQQGSTAADTTTGTVTLATWGGFNEAASFMWDGKASEILIFSTPHNSGGTRAAIEDNQSAFFSTP